MSLSPLCIYSYNFSYTNKRPLKYLSVNSKMLPEEIFLLVLKSILTIVIFILCYFLKTYMDKKPLGMQTILDQTVKDLLVIYVFNDITTWFVAVNFIEQSYGHFASIMLVSVAYYVIKVFILQLIVSTIIRGHS